MKILAGVVGEKRVLKRLWTWAVCCQRRAGPYGASWAAGFLGRSGEQ